MDNGEIKMNSKIIPQYTYIEIPGGNYIIHTRPPFLIGRIWMYKSLPELNEQIEKITPLSYVQMETHAIAISLWTVLNDRLIVHSETKEELKKVMEGMIDFFKETRFDGAKFYDKFKI